MSRFASLLAAAALAGSAAAPAAAQYYPPQYPQPVPSYPYPQPSPGPAYPYPYLDQTYGANQGAIGAIIDSLIGNRYNVSDRQAIRQCAFAAVQRAQNGYPGGYQPYPGYNNFIRVTAITDVQRRSSSVRVRGMLGRGRFNAQPYDPRYGYGYGGGYGGGEVSFRCDVDYRGYVRNLRLQPLARAY